MLLHQAPPVLSVFYWAVGRVLRRDRVLWRSRKVSPVSVPVTATDRPPRNWSWPDTRLTSHHLPVRLRPAQVEGPLRHSSHRAGATRQSSHHAGATDAEFTQLLTYLLVVV